MPELDFLTNVESSFLNVFMADPMLKQYNWKRWDSDEEKELPRAALGLRSRRDPDETPYHRIEVTLKIEGRPKRLKLSAVMNEVIKVLSTTNELDLGAASGGTVAFIGKADLVTQDRPITEGLRTWTLGFVIYAVPMPQN